MMLTIGLHPPLRGIIFLITLSFTYASINRQAIVSLYNPVRTSSDPNTPMQVGNGNFAFGADVTGLQTFLPFAIMSTWGWKNDSFPPGRTLEDIKDYKGVSWDSHGRLVQYEFGGEADIQQWLISNPNRVNLGRVGLLFLDDEGREVVVEEKELEAVHQELDLWKGTIKSQFRYRGEQVKVEVRSSQSDSAIAVSVDSPLVLKGGLGLFLDFPWKDGSQKFSAPFVGTWNETSKHTTTLAHGPHFGVNVQAQITHTLVNSTFFTSIGSPDRLQVLRVSSDAHRYSVLPSRGQDSPLETVIGYSQNESRGVQHFDDIVSESEEAWNEYWTRSGFVDVLTGSTDPRANELQRRIILSRYLMRVNEASDLSPQEVRTSEL